MQLLHGMENTTTLMLAQFAAGLVHFADYKRCKVVGDLLGVDDPTRGPTFDHRAAFFLYRLLAELRTVRLTFRSEKTLPREKTNIVSNRIIENRIEEKTNEGAREGRGEVCGYDILM